MTFGLVACPPRSEQGLQAAALCATVFARPLAAELALLARYSLHPSCQLWLATHQSQVIGVALAAELQAGQWWLESLRPYLPQDRPLEGVYGATEIASLAVRADWRGRGVGRALLAAALHDKTKAFLSVERRNTQAQAFYAQHGFVGFLPNIMFPGVEEAYSVLAWRRA